MKLKLLILCSIMLSLLMACGDKKDQERASAKQADSLKKVATTNNRIMGVGRIEPEDGLMNITAGTSGKITALLVKENQDVAKGQPLLAIEMAIENAQLAQAQSKIATQKAAAEANKANWEANQVNFQNAKLTHERNVQLFEGKALTKQTLDDSKANMDKLAKEVNASEANWEQAKQRIGELEADIRYYQTVVNQKKVLAPVAGKILSLPVKMGEYVSNATQIAEFSPAGSLIAKTEVDELYAEKVQLGQQAYIFSQTSGDTLAKGTVSFMANFLKSKSLFKDQSTEQEDRRVREVHIRLEKGKMPLIGSRVDCLILLK